MNLCSAHGVKTSSDAPMEHCVYHRDCHHHHCKCSWSIASIDNMEDNESQTALLKLFKVAICCNCLLEYLSHEGIKSLTITSQCKDSEHILYRLTYRLSVKKNPHLEHHAKPSSDFLLRFGVANRRRIPQTLPAWPQRFCCEAALNRSWRSSWETRLPVWMRPENDL